MDTKIQELQQKYNAEIIQDQAHNCNIVVSSEEFSVPDKVMLGYLLNTNRIEFKVSLKYVTISRLAEILSKYVPGPKEFIQAINVQNHGVIITVENEEIDQEWDKISDILEQDGYAKFWKLNDLVVHKGLSLEQPNRPKIDSIDCGLLSNLLAKCDTVEAFLNAI
jgi:hypothetical protein